MSQKIRSYEPATGALLWEGETGNVGEEVERVRSAWPAWAAEPVTFRIETLRRFSNIVRGEEAALTDLIARDTGKPLWDAREEVAAVIASADLAVAAYSERTGQRRLEGDLGARQRLRHKPHGVLALITPHCRPAQIPCSLIVPALIAGNGIVFKPSEHVPGTAALLVTLLRQAGVPDDLVRLLPGGAQVGQDLAAHEDVCGVLFTGSTRNGIAIAQALGGQPEKIVALNMSGNNPIVVWDAPDISAAATIVVQSAFASSGQHCTCARRLIVRESIAADLIAEIRKITDRLIIDHPHAELAPYMGPVVNDRAADGLTESFLYLMSKGARPIKHPMRPQAGLPFLAPAIIDITDASERPDVELFGPMLQIIRVDDFESAIAQANASRYALCASLIGGSPEQYNQFWSNVRAGIINWNRPTTAVSDGAPFGGIGVSGNHRAAGRYAADFCAYPVASSEVEQVRAAIGIGLRAIDTSAMGD